MMNALHVIACVVAAFGTYRVAVFAHARIRTVIGRPTTTMGTLQAIGWGLAGFFLWAGGLGPLGIATLGLLTMVLLFVGFVASVALAILAPVLRAHQETVLARSAKIQARLEALVEREQRY